nr:unnamed protein product [Callosobruchus analis]
METVTGGIMISGTYPSPFGFGTNSSARTNAFAVGPYWKMNLRTIVPQGSWKCFKGYLLTSYSVGPGSAAVFAEDFYPNGPVTDAIDEGRFHKMPILFGMNSEECVSPTYLEFLPKIKRKAEKWEQEIWKMIDATVNVQDKVKAAEDMKLFCGSSSSCQSTNIISILSYITFKLIIDLANLSIGVEGVARGEDQFLYWNSTITPINKLLLPNLKLTVQRMVRLLSNFPILKPNALFQNLEWPEFDSRSLLYLKIDSNLEVLHDMRSFSKKRAVYDKNRYLFIKGIWVYIWYKGFISNIMTTISLLHSIHVKLTKRCLMYLF